MCCRLWRPARRQIVPIARVVAEKGLRTKTNEIGAEDMHEYAYHGQMRRTFAEGG